MIAGNGEQAVLVAVQEIAGTDPQASDLDPDTDRGNRPHTVRNDGAKRECGQAQFPNSGHVADTGAAHYADDPVPGQPRSHHVAQVAAPFGCRTDFRADHDTRLRGGGHGRHQVREARIVGCEPGSRRVDRDRHRVSDHRSWLGHEATQPQVRVALGPIADTESLHRVGHGGTVSVA